MIHVDKPAARACPGCGHATRKDKGTKPQTFTCLCPRGRCHGPKQIVDEHGTAQLVWPKYTFYDL